MSLTPTGTLNAVCVLISSNQAFSTATITSVEYGGVTMTQEALEDKTTGENAWTAIYTLYSGIPAGSQDAVVVMSNATTARLMCAFGLNGDAPMSTVTTTAYQNDNVADPTATLSLGGITSYCAQAIYTGKSATTGWSPLAGWGSDFNHEIDFGPSTGGLESYDTIASADVTIGFTQTADDAMMMGIAIRESAGGGGGSTPKGPLGHPFFGPFGGPIS